MSTRRRQIPWMLIGVIALAALPWIGSRYATFVATDIAILALFATSLNLLLGSTGLVSFGHAAYFGIGAYTCAILTKTYGLPFPIALAAAPLLAGMFALVFGFFCVRLTRIYFAMLTLAFAQIVWGVCLKWNSVTGGEQGLSDVPYPALAWMGALPLLDRLRSAEQFYLVVLVLVAACLWVLRTITASPFGRMLTVIRENPERARFIGLNVRRYELAAFVIAGALAGVAGALFGVFNQGVFPDSMYWSKSAEVLIMTILGGMGFFWGPAVGAAALVWMNQEIAAFTRYWPFVLGTILILLLFVFPAGIVGALDAARRRLRPEPHGVTIALPLLDVRDVRKRFGGFTAVDGVSLSVAPREIVAIIGPNGAGKSTFFNLVTGHLRPDEGQVRFDGSDITGGAPHDICRRGMGRSFQRINIFPKLTVFQNVQAAIIAHRGAGTRLWGRSADLFRDETTALLESIGLADRAEATSGELSYGAQKQIELGIALASEPRLLLLDEPTAGMSAQETRDAVALLQRIASARALSLLFTEHDMGVVFSISHRIAVLHQGRLIAAGRPDDVRADADVRRIYLGGMA